MNDLAQQIYGAAPTFLQNILVSAYGASLYRQRYGAFADKALQQLLQSQSLSPEGMHRLQNDTFVKVGRHAIESVPFYRNWAASESVKAGDIRSLDDIKIFPILEKELVRARPMDFVSDKRRIGRQRYSILTSGTTGTPLQIFFERHERQFHYAFFSRLRSWFNLPARSKRVTFFGRLIQPPEDNRPPFWRHDVTQRNLIMSSYHLSPKNLPLYYRKILEYAPEEIIGYPSSIYTLSNFVVRSGLPRIPVRLVVTTAETLLQHQRETISAAVTGEVIDQYGCAEMAVFASECEHHTMHVHPEHGLVEIVDDAGQAVTSGVGRAIVTGFVNQTMPFIRYSIGDRLELAPGSALCTCGRAFPIIREIVGRNDEVIYRTDGTPVGRLSPVFKSNSNIVRAKVVQSESGQITIRIVSESEFSSEERVQLIAEMRKRVGPDFPIDIVIDRDIPIGPNGKFKLVESRYRPSLDQSG